MLLTAPAQDARLQPKNYIVGDFAGIGLISCTGANGASMSWTSFQAWTHGAPMAAPPVENTMAELRRRSGLTWEQIAQVMGVERRTLHFWEAGRGMRPVHEERLQRVLQVIRRADRGSSTATREFLLDVSRGPMLKDLLAEDNLDLALARVAGLAAPRLEARPGPLSHEVKASRRNLPLAERLDLRDDPVTLPAAGPAKPAKVTRVGRK